MNELLSKKFIFAISVSVMGFVLVLTKYTDAETYFKFVELIGGIYVAGNISDKINDSLVEKEAIKVNGKDSL